MKIGSKQKCPCGSGKKYKHCHRGFSFKQVIMKSPFQFEKKLFDSDTAETKAVLEWCFAATLGPLDFGLKTYSASMHSLQGQRLNPDDSRGLILGFHAKAIDQVIAIGALVDSGSIGPAVGQLRTLFEMYLYQAYILESDTETRITNYKLSFLRDNATWAKRMVAYGDNSAKMHAFASTVLDKSQSLPRNRSWTGKTIEQLATDLGIGKLYLAIYRTACAATHSMDILSCYNPIFHQVWNQAIHNEPLFISNFGVFSASDAAGLVFYMHFLPYALFANTTSFLNISLDQNEDAFVKACRAVLSDQNLSVTSSMDEIMQAHRELSSNFS